MDEGRRRPRRSGDAELHLPDVERAAGPITDADSYLRQSYDPTGVARGWRRSGCLVMIVVGGLNVVALLVIATQGR